MHEYRVHEILRVVDGDTIDCRVILKQDKANLGMGLLMDQRLVATVRYRLAGIDTPELTGPNAEPAGMEARDFTRAWLNDHPRLKVHTEKGSDATVGIGDGAFGRWLARFKDADTGDDLTTALRLMGYVRHNGQLMRTEQA